MTLDSTVFGAVRSSRPVGLQCPNHCGKPFPPCRNVLSVMDGPCAPLHLKNGIPVYLLPGQIRHLALPSMPMDGRETVHVFTDGSCFNPQYHDTRFAAYAIVIANPLFASQPCLFESAPPSWHPPNLYVS